jgi:hypothetical protein
MGVVAGEEGGATIFIGDVAKAHVLWRTDYK